MLKKVTGGEKGYVNKQRIDEMEAKTEKMLSNILTEDIVSVIKKYTSLKIKMSDLLKILTLINDDDILLLPISKDSVSDFFPDRHFNFCKFCGYCDSNDDFFVTPINVFDKNFEHFEYYYADGFDFGDEFGADKILMCENCIKNIETLTKFGFVRRPTKDDCGCENCWCHRESIIVNEERFKQLKDNFVNILQIELP